MPTGETKREETQAWAEGSSSVCLFDPPWSISGPLRAHGDVTPGGSRTHRHCQKLPDPDTLNASQEKAGLFVKHLLCVRQPRGTRGHWGPEGSGLLFKVTELTDRRDMNPPTGRRLTLKLRRQGRWDETGRPGLTATHLAGGAPHSCPPTRVPSTGEKPPRPMGTVLRRRTRCLLFDGRRHQTKPAPDQSPNISPQTRQALPPPHVLSQCHTHVLSHTCTCIPSQTFSHTRMFSLTRSLSLALLGPHGHRALGHEQVLCAPTRAQGTGSPREGCRAMSREHPLGQGPKEL